MFLLNRHTKNGAVLPKNTLLKRAFQAILLAGLLSIFINVYFAVHSSCVCLSNLPIIHCISCSLFTVCYICSIRHLCIFCHSCIVCWSAAIHHFCVICQSFTVSFVAHSTYVHLLCLPFVYYPIVRAISINHSKFPCVLQSTTCSWGLDYMRVHCSILLLH